MKTVWCAVMSKRDAADALRCGTTVYNYTYNTTFLLTITTGYCAYILLLLKDIGLTYRCVPMK